MAHSTEHPISCPGCRTSYQVPATMSGASVTCENCGADFVLPDFYRPEDDLGILVEAPANLPIDELVPPPPKPALSGPLKSLLLVLTGAVLVVGVSSLLKHKGPSAAETPSAGSDPEKDSGPPAHFTSIPTDLTPPEVPASGPTDPTPAAESSPAAPDTTPTPPPLEPIAEAETIPPSSPPTSGSLPMAENESPPEVTTSASKDTEAQTAEAALSLPPAPAPEPLPEPAAPLAESPPTPAILTAPAPAASPAAAAAIRKDSRKALEHFLTSTTAEQRLAVTLNPAKAKASMEAFQQAREGKPFALTELAFLTEGELPDSKWHFHLYNVFLSDQEAPIPVAAEQTADGYRIDWHAFHESYTHQLRDFFATPTEKPGRFRVVMRRAHYFGPPVHGQDTARIAYSIEPPQRDEIFYAWVDKESLVYQEKLATGERATWDAESYVMVELLWKGDDKRGRWVGVSRIVADNWRGE